MLKRVTYTLALLALAGMGTVAHAQAVGGPGAAITVTTDSATTNLTADMKSVTFINTGSVQVNGQVFYSGMATAAATTSSPLILPAGQAVSINFEAPVRSVSLICASGSSTVVVMGIVPKPGPTP